jgi:hypothetical protein
MDRCLSIESPVREHRICEDGMSEPWVHVGAPVLVASGSFQGFEGAVESIDPLADAVIVKLELFGRTVPLTFPLSSVGEHLTLFGDQPTISCCPQAEIRQSDLLSECPEPDATYRTDGWWSTTHALLQVSRSGSDHRLIVRSHNLTWPSRERMVWSVREVPLTDAEWTAFTRLIEECRFWELPYDDGRRISRTSQRWYWRLEGYERGRYHAVVRQAGKPRSEISACCEYMCAMAGLGQ